MSLKTETPEEQQNITVQLMQPSKCVALCEECEAGSTHTNVTHWQRAEPSSFGKEQISLANRKRRGEKEVERTERRYWKIVLTFYLDRVEIHCLFGKIRLCVCTINTASVCVSDMAGALMCMKVCLLAGVAPSQRNEQRGRLLSFFFTIKTETRNQRNTKNKSIFLPIEVVAGTGSLDTARIEHLT